MNAAQQEAIHRLWDELTDFPGSETDQALVHFIDGICQLIGAGNAFWLGAVRLSATVPEDPLKGWRPRANRYLHPAPAHEEAYRAQLASIHRHEANAGTTMAISGAGTFRSFRIRQVLPSEWFQSEYFKAYQAARGFHDQCYVVFPLHEDYESYFSFQRVGVKEDFSATDEAIAAYALRAVKWFHRQLALSYGLLIAEERLSPTQRQVTQLLLTERSEKQIAAEIGKSPHTAHRHIVEIFRKFGVNSRASLMALWLGQPPPRSTE
jgi:DNA-binding CsgD family transcriptional regulator